MASAGKTKAQLLEALQSMERQIAELEQRLAGTGRQEDPSSGGVIGKAEIIKQPVREIEPFYRIALDKSNDIVVIIQDGRYVYVNDRFLEIFGVTRQDALNIPFGGLIHEDDRQAAMSYYRQRQDGESVPPVHEVRLKKPDGSFMHVEISAMTIEHQGKNASLAFIRDITERKRLEKTLRETSVHYDNLIRSVSDIIMVMDSQGNVTFESPSTAVILGYPPGHFLGNTPFPYIHEDDVVRVLNDFNEVVRRENPGLPTQFRIRKSDGTWVYLEALGNNLVESPGIHGIVITARNVTERRHMEDRLRESEARFRDLVDLLPQVVFEIDAQGIFTFVNRFGLALFGYTDEEVAAGLHAVQVIAPVDRQRAAENIMTSLRGERVRPGMEYTAVKKSGEEFPVYISSTRVQKEGVVLGLRGILIDISEIKQAREALRGSDERYRSIFENALEGIYQSTPEGRFIGVNPAMAKLCGYESPEEMMASITDISTQYYADPKERERFKRLLDEYGRMDEIEYRISRKDGSTIWVSVSARAVRNEWGDLQYYEGTVQDISLRKQAEAALIEKKDELDRFFNVNIDLLCIADMDGYFRRLNRAWEKTLGYEIKDLEGRRFLDLVHPDDMGKTLEAIARLVDQDEVIDFVNRYRCRNGSYRWIEWRSHPAGNIIYAAASDITERKKTEEALRESEEKYRLLVENANEGVYVLQDGIFRYVNRMCSEVLGIPAAGLIGMSMLDFLHPDDREKARSQHLRMLCGALDEARTDFRILMQHGGERWADVKSVRITWDGKAATLNFATDITNRRQMEAGLRESEERYSALFDRSLDCVYVIDFEGNFIDANPAALNLLGYERTDIHSLNITSLLEERDLSKGLQDFNEIIQTGFQKEVGEYRLKCKDGRCITLETQASVVYHDNKPHSVLGVARDITERKRAEENIRILADLSDISPLSITVHDLQGNFLYANQKTFDLHGYSKEEFLARNLHEIDVPESANLIEMRIRKIMEIGEAKFEVEHYRKDGTCLPLEVFVKATEWGGKKVLLSAASDITERKRAAEALRYSEQRLQRAEKMEALGTLAGGVAHDLNNVLGVVIGYAELLIDSVDDLSPLRSRIVNIMKGGERAAAIVQDLLTLARRGVSTMHVVNLNHIIADFQRLPEFAALCSHHPSMRLQTDLEPALLNISGSPVHLSKSLYNLISNAGEAMPKGGVLTIKTTNQYLDQPIQGYDEIKEGDYVVLSISDTGGGIPASDLQHIFEPFYTKKVMGRSGTGLGLAVVWGTVKDHQGYINVQSEEGIGSIFTLYFPVTRDEISAKAVSVSISEYMGHGESILIVDDVEGQRDLAVEMLRSLNYNVACVSSGEEAVVYLKEHAVDLMVLDMIMDPGMDGLDTYRSVLNIHPKQKAIIVSGFSETERVNATQALGAGTYVRKPYIIEKLGLAVKKELDRSK